MILITIITIIISTELKNSLIHSVLTVNNSTADLSSYVN